MSQPGDQASAWVDNGRVRASHADREQLIGVLKAAFVQGRLTKDEFDTRVSQAFAARTYAELAAIIADIPAGPIAVQPARQAGGLPADRAWGRAGGQAAGRARNPAGEAVAWSVAATFVAVILVASTFLDPRDFLLVAGIISASYSRPEPSCSTHASSDARADSFFPVTLLVPGDPARLLRLA